MRIKHAAVVAGLAFGLMSGAAKAAYTVKIDQVGANVVATGSGSIDISSFEYDTSAGTTSFIDPGSPDLVIGSQGGGDTYDGFNFPVFGNSISDNASTFSGLEVGFLGAEHQLVVPIGYTSSDPLGISTATFDNETLASFGLTPGSSFTYSFPSSGPESFPDSFTINVGTVPLPPSAPMFGTALLALGAAGYSLKRKGKTAA